MSAVVADNTSNSILIDELSDFDDAEGHGPKAVPESVASSDMSNLECYHSGTSFEF